MSVFVLANWLLAAVTAMVLFSAIWGDRSLLLKPSIMAVLFFHVMCQWGTAIHAALIESFLPRPWVFVLLSHGFPLIGLAVALLTWRRSARALWARVKSDEPCAVSRKNKAGWFCLMPVKKKESIILSTLSNRYFFPPARPIIQFRLLSC